MLKSDRGKRCEDETGQRWNKHMKKKKKKKKKKEKEKEKE